MAVSRSDMRAEEIPPWSARFPALRLLRALYPANLLHILRTANTDQLCSERKLLRRYPLAKTEWGIVFPHGMGDLYLTCAFARAVREQRGGDGFAVFVRPDHAYLPTLFPAVTRIVPVADFNLKRLQQNFHFERGRLFSVFPLHNFLNVMGHNGVHFLDYYCLFLNLELGTRPSPPRPQSRDELERGRALLRKEGLRPGRTILVAPDASSVRLVPAEFWPELAAAFRARGFDVATNSPKGAEHRISGLPPLDVPLELFISVATAAGSVVSIRSGVCDLLAHADCRLTIVYPDEPDEARRRILRGFSLRESGLRPDAHEVWYRTGRLRDAIEGVLAGLEETRSQARS